MIDAAKVKAYREEHGVGMQDARRILERADRKERIAALQQSLESMPRSADRVVLHGILALLDEMNP